MGTMAWVASDLLAGVAPPNSTLSLAANETRSLAARAGHAGAHVGGDASTTSPRKPAPPPAASDPTDDAGVVDGDGVMA